MGTYSKIILKDSVSNMQVNEINRELSKRGIPIEIDGGIEYGAFVTEEMIAEDVRFMNEDPEGLKQAKGWKRPITIEFFEANWDFVRRRQFCRKIRAEDEIRDIAIVIAWAEENPDLIDQSKSSYWKREDCDSILLRPLESFI